MRPYFIKGSLQEDQTMDFPIIEDGVERPFIRASHHAPEKTEKYTKNQKILFMLQFRREL